MSLESYSIATAKAAINEGSCYKIYSTCAKTCYDRDEANSNTCVQNCVAGYKFCAKVAGSRGTSAAAGKRATNGGADTQIFPPATSTKNGGVTVTNGTITNGAGGVTVTNGTITSSGRVTVTNGTITNGGGATQSATQLKPAGGLPGIDKRPGRNAQ